MSKFNNSAVLPSKPSSSKKQMTVNYAGGKAYVQSDMAQFASILLTSFLKDKFYESEKATMERIQALMLKVDPLFAAKTAIYARREFGMRSVSHFVAAEIAKNVKGADWTGNFFERIIRRPDDITEILSCYMSLYGKPIPNSLKRGLGRALSKLNEFSLAKYKQDNAAMSMVDAVNLLHPMHTPALRKLIKGKLPLADTWETNITRVGQNNDSKEEKTEAKGEEWGNLVKEKKLAYMALVRNLRNILTYAPGVIDQVCEQLVDEAAIKKSLMFPFRFLTAINIVKEVSSSESSKVMDALNDAVEISLANVPQFDGKTLVVLDSSGSMQGKPAEIGSLFSATLLKANQSADFMLFSNDAKYVNISTRDSLLTIAKNIPFISGGTNFHSIFQKANKAYDRIVILSDMMGWIGNDCPTVEYKAYCKKYDATPKIYSFDLNGYGSLQFPEKNVYCLAGFSDKVFDIMGMLEQDQDALVNKINDVEFSSE